MSIAIQHRAKESQLVRNPRLGFAITRRITLRIFRSLSLWVVSCGFAFSPQSPIRVKPLHLDEGYKP